MRNFLVLAMAAALVAGCKKSEKSGMKAMAAAMPPSAAAAQQPAGETGPLKGKVLEKIEAATYSYLRLQTAEGETWAAVPATETAVGSEVTVVNPMPMHGFESKALGRKFEKIFFGELGEGGAGAAAPKMPPAAAPAAAAPSAHPPIAIPDEPEAIKVEKAQGPNARTVAELFAQKDALKDKKVTIKAKVVKASFGIMGKNWLHLRDGTGTAATGDNDLTVTTMDNVERGDVVTVDGVVRVDKDFGAGYRYGVIVEEAKVTK